MRRYIIHEGSKEAYHAGSKATKDCEDILLRRGFRKIDICNYQDETGIWIKVKKRLQLIKLAKVKRNSIMVVQHPMYIGSAYMRMLKIIKQLKKIKFIFVIHDLESLRGLFSEYTSLYQFLDEMMFQIGDAFIAHNEKMKEYLVKERKVDKNKIIILELFDYLAGEKKDKHKRYNKNVEIVIAGNLSPEKSKYIYKLKELNTSLHFSLYGLNYDSMSLDAENWTYKGVFPPTELVDVLHGSYGLIWDGDDLMTCTGNTGNYLKYNNPHKISLYIAAEIPIIIWKQAALAEYVTAKGIGIAIDNLAELELAVGAVSKEAYKQMKENLKGIAKKIREGYFLDTAYEKAEIKVSK